MGGGVLEEEVVVRATIEAWAAAVRRRDVAGILRNHASDIVMFDVPPPFQSKGIEAYRETWNSFFSWTSDPIPFDIVDMTVTAGGDVAFAFAAMQCAGPGAEGVHEGLDFPLTVGLRKIGGQWTIIHEHHSVPAVD
jgi:ketosteroid isomerase-like protein